MSTENLSRTEAINKLKELSEKIRVCMFATNLENLPIISRPMSLQECDDEGNLWFISSHASEKNMDIEKDNRVQLFFMDNGNYRYLSVYGKAFIYRDAATIEEKWTPMANAWFDGKDDPNVSIIRVTPENTYYWDTKAGKVISFLSFAWAAITGKNTDNSDGVQGKIRI